MGGDNDGGALIGQLPEQHHHQGFGAGVKARGRLIQEEHSGLGKQFNAQAHPLTLPPTQGGDGVVPALRVELQSIQHRFHAPIDLFIRDVFRQSQLGRVVQASPHAQLPVHDVFLGDEANGRFQRLQVAVQILSVVPNLTRGGFYKAVQDVHECGLTCSARSQKSNQLFRLNHQRDVVQEQFGFSAGPIRDLEAYSNGIESHHASVRRVGKTCSGKVKLGGANDNPVQLLELVPLHLDSVHEGPVGGPKVNQNDLAIVLDDFRVSLGDHRVVNDHVIRGVAANRDAVFVQANLFNFQLRLKSRLEDQGFAGIAAEGDVISVMQFPAHNPQAIHERPVGGTVRQQHSLLFKRQLRVHSRN